MSEFRPRLLLCLVAILALAALGISATFSADVGRAADKSGLDSRGYVWSATRIESGIRLRGSVPTDEDRRTVLGMVKAHFPDLQVEDRLKVADAGAPPQDQWLGAVSFGLKQLSHLKRGSARLYDVALKVDGEARSAADYVEVKKALAGPLPTGLVVASESIKPPIADPFVFVADLGANELSLSGSVPNENARKHVRELSRQLFRRPGLDDRLELASGAPKNWNEAVIAALRALSQLESGKIALSGLAVTIQGVAPDQGHRGGGVLSAQARFAGAVLHLREHQLERGGRAAGYRRPSAPAHQGDGAHRRPVAGRLVAGAVALDRRRVRRRLRSRSPFTAGLNRWRRRTRRWSRPFPAL